MTERKHAIFDYNANHGSFAGWALAEALGKLDSKTWAKVEPPLMVTFSINGIELDFERVMKFMDEQFQKLVDARAREIVTEKFDNMLAAFRDGEEKVKSAMDDLLDKLGGEK